MILCTMPEFQTSAGCMCRKSGIIYDPPRWHSQDEVNELHRRHIESVTRLSARIEQLERENAKLRSDFEEMGSKFLQAKFGAAKARREALEEAAKMAEGPSAGWGEFVGGTPERDKIAAAIRRLAEMEGA